MTLRPVVHLGSHIENSKLDGVGKFGIYTSSINAQSCSRCFKNSRARSTSTQHLIKSRDFFIESFLQMYFEGKWLQNRLRSGTRESRSLLAVDIQGHQR